MNLLSRPQLQQVAGSHAFGGSSCGAWGGILWGRGTHLQLYHRG